MNIENEHTSFLHSSRNDENQDLSINNGNKDLPQQRETNVSNNNNQTIPVVCNETEESVLIVS